MKKPTAWKTFLGSFDFWNDDAIIFKGGAYTTEDGTGTRPQLGIAVTDMYFSGGTIECDVHFESSSEPQAAMIILGRNPENGSLICAGLDHEAGFAIMAYHGPSNGGWETLAHSGDATERAGSVKCRLRCTLRGSLIRLFVDQVEVLRHALNFSWPTNQCGVFCRSLLDVRISNFRCENHRRKCFLVMQFGDPYDKLYHDVIRPITLEYGYETTRADETFGPGLIVADIVSQIINADLVIADITPQNPNVFYEVGYSHASGKQTILLCERGKTLPFDVSPFRVLFYDNTIAGKSQLERGLRNHLAAVATQRGLLQDGEYSLP